jgi:hypothetical protein
VKNNAKIQTDKNDLSNASVSVKMLQEYCIITLNPTQHPLLSLGHPRGRQLVKNIAARFIK